MLGGVKDRQEIMTTRQKKVEERNMGEVEQIQPQDDGAVGGDHPKNNTNNKNKKDDSSRRNRSRTTPSPYFTHITLLSSFTCLSVLSTQIACTVLRDHLFIWTVFSPKYLFVVAGSVGMHLGVNVLVGGMGWWWVGGVSG